MKIIKHRNLNDCKVLVESEKGGKHYALVQTSMRKVWSWKAGWHWKETTKDIYYILWGNEPNYETMGYTGVFTEKGNAVKSQSNAISLFTKMMIAGEHLHFKM
jgi:hypothetical protein